MVIIKTILLDLDGTLIDTMDSKFDIYRDGKATVNVNAIPIFAGAKEFVNKVKSEGHQVFIVSDSHPRFVNPIANQIFNLECLSLANKPNTEKTIDFINEKSQIKLPSSRIFMVGDSPMDIKIARKLKIPSIFIAHSQDYNPEKWTLAEKMGPTYSCTDFNGLHDIIENPLENLLCIEGLQYSDDCIGSIKINGSDYITHEGRRQYQIALARQDMGMCDIFAKGDWYRQFSSPTRTLPFLIKLSEGLRNYIKYFEKKQQIKFDILTYVSDKVTTVPPRKMEEFVALVDCGIPIKKLTVWRDEIKGSIRNEPKRRNRYVFVKEYLYINSNSDLVGKNIVIIDDQITTGATMQAITEMLWEKGVSHILYISLFRMIDEIGTGIKCPKCEKELTIKNRKSDGKRFYSCSPPQFGGTGCGHIQNID